MQYSLHRKPNLPLPQLYSLFGLLSIIGDPPADGNKNVLIFNLPSYESCCKSVKRWVKRAGIDKHISWYCARHTFAVNILNNGANIKTLASLFGHSGLKHTEKYPRAVDKLKEEAINSLPEFETEIRRSVTAELQIR